jgi:hypothetical protein
MATSWPFFFTVSTAAFRTAVAAFVRETRKEISPENAKISRLISHHRSACPEGKRKMRKLKQFPRNASMNIVKWKKTFFCVSRS